MRGPCCCSLPARCITHSAMSTHFRIPVPMFWFGIFFSASLPFLFLSHPHVNHALLLTSCHSTAGIGELLFFSFSTHLHLVGRFRSRLMLMIFNFVYFSAPVAGLVAWHVVRARSTWFTEAQNTQTANHTHKYCLHINNRSNNKQTGCSSSSITGILQLRHCLSCVKHSTDSFILSKNGMNSFRWLFCNHALGWIFSID